MRNSIAKVRNFAKTHPTQIHFAAQAGITVMCVASAVVTFIDSKNENATENN